jgi:threonyl-tRNA synthetase
MSEDKLAHKRHSLAHLLAAAVLELYPDTKNTIGPAIDNGFYYDFEFSSPISNSDLKEIEKKMKRLFNSWKSFEKKEVSPEEAREVYNDNPYKLELIEEIIGKGESVTLYTSGKFTDLCRGGHVEDMKEINNDAWKLSRVAGAYWRGDEKNKMLTRIYGLAFDTKEELEAYEKQQEEALKRDHRKLGKELDLFFVDDMVGKGLVMWLPKGNIIKSKIENLAEEMEKEAGYQRVTTPHIAREELFLTSGHLPYYKESMYPAMVMDDGTYYLRAMNCPHHHRIYLHKPRSYRDLPLRIAEYGTVYRNELSGTLAGLLRVRGLAMNDAHIYLRKDQIKDEFKSVMKLTMDYFKIFGLENYWFRLSKWDPNHTDKYINQPENWEYTESVLREVLTEMKVPFTEADDEAAFYGPKVDVQFKSVIGREETMSTIQLDFIARERFGLKYTDSDGKENNEVFVIHRAPLSTHERFMAFLIEHYAGAFPLWLSPVQVRVLPIGESHFAYATEVMDKLKLAGVRVELDISDETLGKKIRNTKTEKVPYALVIGDKEVEGKLVMVESRDSGNMGTQSVEELVEKLKKEIQDKK